MMRGRKPTDGRTKLVRSRLQTKRRMKRSPIRRSKRKQGRRSMMMELKKLMRVYLLRRDVTCVVAGDGFGGCGGPLQGAHIKPKGTYRSLEFHPENVVLMCWRHHKHFWHTDVDTAGAWFRNKYPERAALLNELAQKPKAGKLDLDRVRNDLERLTSPDP